ncbi:hypothetical protein K2173_007415 [Erythroxylum novogranatense]|uniref:DUF3741 domain-containing protein n=1 Tax=Erythroxylum novogranatense TaxID=1862640 RepID=A0AAV8T7D4_9ROSI|nr:hypothetical protein K2173_007415 [Erythroxylum novogranatense]
MNELSERVKGYNSDKVFDEKLFETSAIAWIRIKVMIPKMLKDPFEDREGERELTSTSNFQFRASSYYVGTGPGTGFPTSTNSERNLTTREKKPKTLFILLSFVNGMLRLEPGSIPEERSMAKRSDFAQKLLDDLRLRKQRMAAPQTSNTSKLKTGDAYSYSMQTYRGSRDMKARQPNGVKTGNMQNGSRGGGKSLAVREGSKQIVPYGRDQNSAQTGDFSLALTFALENGGKLQRVDSLGNSTVLSFLNQINRGSLDLGKTENSIRRRSMDRSSTGGFAAFSPLHISEIAKGAQKLNQILRACSNGLKFDSYSIEIGKELLKGAIDLEESLRMLVNLQEASDYMIKPQSKSRITLLDEDEDDNNNSIHSDRHKQNDRSIVSFDNSSRNSRYILTYSSEAANFNQQARALSASSSASNKRSSNYGREQNTLAAFSERKDHLSSSTSKTEKARIPNVIAKLMGLQELPEAEDSKKTIRKEYSSKVTKRPAEGSNSHQKRKKDAKNEMSPIKTPNDAHSSKMKAIHEAAYGLKAENNLSGERKPPEEAMEKIKPMRISNKANTKIDKHHVSIVPLNQTTENRKDTQEKQRKQDYPKPEEQKGKERGETHDSLLRHALGQTASHRQKGSEAAMGLQGQMKSNLGMIRTENRDVKKHLSHNHKKSPNDLALQQPRILQNSEKKDNMHHVGDSNPQKGSESLSKTLPRPTDASPNMKNKYWPLSQEHTNGMQSVGIPNNRHDEDLLRGKSSTHFSTEMQDSVNTSSKHYTPPGNMTSESNRGKSIVSAAKEEKSVQLPASKKGRAKIQEVETLPKINELVTRKGGASQNMGRVSKRPISILQEVKQRKHEKPGEFREVDRKTSKSKEIEARILQSNKPVASRQQSSALSELQLKDEQDSNLYCPPLDNECQLISTEMLLPDKNNINSMVRNDSHSGNMVLDSFDGAREVNIVDTHNSSQSNNQKQPRIEAPKPLTASENQLKQILMKSQLFLNTAEALFKLNIPFDILHSPESLELEYQDKEGNITLDCGYELMKRKGKRQELSVHPFMKVSVACTRVTSLDELIKLLHQDIATLKSYGRDDGADCLVEDYLPKMLEEDVYDREPDLNCMWDFGWDITRFASLEKDDVVRDVERNVLSGLLDEVTRDLLVRV